VGGEVSLFPSLSQCFLCVVWELPVGVGSCAVFPFPPPYPLN